jgi:DNA repair protein SbcC/Rad50
MQILSVTLTNFKTHQDKQFEFQPGTNAICGENGAGKTSILEAIAWVLFNYQGTYKKEDLIRNGASSAQARVAFISSRDRRTYEVQRSTSQGYLIFDPQLNERLPYTRTKDEVLPWLRQHLGVSPGTDLSQLFANTIGVPQGTFTVDFLLPTEKRKPIFDTVLKVEEYRQTYQQSNSLRKYSEAQSQRLKDLIEQCEEALQSWDALQASHQQLTKDIEDGQKQLDAWDQQSEQLKIQGQALKAQAQQVQTLTAKQQTFISQIEAQQQAQARLAQQLTAAQQSSDLCRQAQPAYEQFLAVEAKIQSLNERGQRRQELLRQQQGLQQSQANSQRDRLKLENQLEQLAAAAQELETLAPALDNQNKLEAEQAKLQAQIQQFANSRFQQETLTANHQNLSREITQVEAECQRLSALQTVVAQIPELEAQRNRLQEQLSRLSAAQQFEQDFSQLIETGQAQQNDYRHQVAAVLTLLEGWTQQFTEITETAIAPIKNTLFQGGILYKETLNQLKGILSDLSAQTDSASLQQQQRTLQGQLQRAYGQQAEFANLSTLQTKQTQLKQQQQQIQQSLATLKQQLASADETQLAFSEIAQQLQQLDNPKGKQQLLKKTLQQQTALQSKQKALVAELAESTAQMAVIAAELTTFDELDAQMQQQQQAKQSHQSGYLQYLQNQQAAAQLETIQTETATLSMTLQQLHSQKAALDTELAALTATFDPQAFDALEQQLNEIKSQADQRRGSLPQQRQRLNDLAQQIEALSATAQKRDRAKLDLKQRDRLKRFIAYARKVYKAAGPRITERYVHNISQEADRLFRELLGRQNVALTWSADYEITIQEGAHTRRFINLSGGEQMCAALAVRLALLKVLADIDVAFFDEPTTNMDRPRRESLAEAIARIKSFNQLFVISHDDTFEQVTDTVITVTRDS